MRESFDYLQSVASPDVVAQFLAAATASGRPWQDLLTQWQSRGLKTTWFTNPQKGAFYRIISASRRMAFLDVGAGCGIVSACLSEDFERGYALEVNPVFVEFMQHRFRADAIANVDVISGSALSIPLPDACVDLVACNGVLHWIPLSQPGLDPRKAQLGSLKEMHRCLRPGGRAVLAVENAWHFDHLKGKSALDTAPGVTALPHSLGWLWNRLVRGRQHRARVYSSFGYRRLLAEAGFRDVKLFALLPACDLPIDIYSLDGPALHEMYLKYHSRAKGKRLVKALSDGLGMPYLLAHFASAFYVVADR